MIGRKKFGLTQDGRQVDILSLRNNHGYQVEVLTLGGIIQSFRLPGPKGEPVDVVLGYDRAEDYEHGQAYLGALIGRCANRISKAAFALNGRRYQLARNDGPNHLHGGPGGFHRRIWTAESDGPRLVLSRFSPAGEENYPGDLKVQVIYELDDGGALSLSYQAEAAADTIINLTNHSYFNLNGAGESDVLDHLLTIRAEDFAEVDEALIPTGRLLPVRGGPLDFTTAKAIGRNIGSDDPQIKNGRGYDHHFVFGETGERRPQAQVFAPRTGLKMEVYTDQPGLQFYSGNFLNGVVGKSGRPYPARFGFCLETQDPPDAMNQPFSPKPILRAGEIYARHTSYQIIST